ncbi:hypothetical protein ACLSY3_07595, partial [Avibacterium avium]|uniref:hypothetical protein n=1 Tax=Avibacterium avium TaxID=751 RepID=UPI003BF8552C
MLIFYRTLHFFSKNCLTKPQDVERITKQQKNEKILQKGVASISKIPIIRRTQRRDVVEIERYTSRRC